MLIFVDVDGTLIDHHQQIPDSSVAAIERARAAGHEIFLATGRSLPEIYPWIFDLGITGVVGASGAFAKHGETVLFDHRLEGAQVRQIAGILNDLGAHWTWQNPDSMWVDPRFVQVFAKAASGHWEAYFQQVGPYLFEGLPPTANKCTYWIPQGVCEVTDLVNMIGSDFTVFPGAVATGEGDMGEIVSRGISKGYAVAEVAQYLGVPLSQTVAIGDSSNDVAMLQTAGLGIAMGGATGGALEAADYVTGHISEGGFASAIDYAMCRCTNSGVAGHLDDEFR
ncbi:MAG: HAD family hydrolase [Actinomycetaceae bacterium]|nr:HAD family hydrolase [Actinomycetaceae bacterium]